jgi:CRP-like cAMP-binding protein
MELLNDYRMQCNVESVEESLLIGIRVEIVRSMAGEDARFLKFIAESLSHKLYTMSNAASINLLNTLESRLASYILSVSDNDNNVYNYEIKTTKLTELATLLGTSYRHLNRVVNSLASKGIIQRQRGIITIKDPDELRKLSNGYLYE